MPCRWPRSADLAPGVAGFVDSLFGLAGKVALVTGSSQGLGLAMAEALGRAGAQVVLNGRDPAKLERAAAPLAAAGLRITPIAADVGRAAEVERLIAAAIARCGRVDVLVNNAGIVRPSAATEAGDDDFEAMLRVNVSGVMTACRAAGRHMLARGSGKIINVASLLSFSGGVGVAGYAATKGAVAQLTKGLSNEWAGRGVQVNALAPGYVRTAMTQALQDDPIRSREILARIPAGRWGEPGDLQGAVLFLASPASDFVTGHVLTVDGGWSAR